MTCRLSDVQTDYVASFIVKGCGFCAQMTENSCRKNRRTLSSAHTVTLGRSIPSLS